MKLSTPLYLLVLIFLSSLSLGMARSGVYDEEARQTEKIEKEYSKQMSGRNNPAKSVASGVKQATYSSTKELLTETAETTASDKPVVGTLEGARTGGSKAIEEAARGVLKVATLGYGDTENMKIEEPQADSDDVTKFKISL